MTADIKIEQESTEPEEAYILELETILSSNTFFTFKPLYYDCILSLSPNVIVKMLIWMHKNGYIVLKGSIRIKGLHKGINLNGPS